MILSSGIKRTKQFVIRTGDKMLVKGIIAHYYYKSKYNDTSIRFSQFRRKNTLTWIYFSEALGLFPDLDEVIPTNRKTAAKLGDYLLGTINTFGGIKSNVERISSKEEIQISYNQASDLFKEYVNNSNK